METMRSYIVYNSHNIDGHYAHVIVYARCMYRALELASQAFREEGETYDFWAIETLTIELLSDDVGNCIGEFVSQIYF